jgi:hypothetical protein
MDSSGFLLGFWGCRHWAEVIIGLDDKDNLTPRVPATTAFADYVTNPVFALPCNLQFPAA